MAQVQEMGLERECLRRHSGIVCGYLTCLGRCRRVALVRWRTQHCKTVHGWNPLVLEDGDGNCRGSDDADSSLVPCPALSIAARERDDQTRRYKCSLSMQNNYGEIDEPNKMRGKVGD